MAKKKGSKKSTKKKSTTSTSKGSKKAAKKGKKSPSKKGAAKKKAPRAMPRIKVDKTTGIVIGLLLIIAVAALIMNPQQTGDESAVVATINGEDITLNEFNENWQFLDDQSKSQVTREQFLTERLVRQELLLQEARARGITVSDDEVRQTLEGVVAQQGGDFSVIEQSLKERGMTWEEALPFFKNQIILQELYDQMLQDTTINESVARQFYDQNPEMFQTQNGTTVSFEQARTQIEQYLMQQQRQQVLQQYVEQLEQNASIDLYTENLQ